MKKYLKDDLIGSYYSIENGELIQYAMNEDGSRSETGGAVDWDHLYLEPPVTLPNGKELNLYKRLKLNERILRGGEK